MNTLIVGANRKPILEFAQGDFLFIDDGPLIDTLTVKTRKFNVSKNAFNPLKDMDYRKATEFVDVLDAVFPEGENTLTKATFKHQLLEALLSRPRMLDRLIPDTKDTAYAYQKVQRLLMSPVLKRVLNTKHTFAFTRAISVRLNRAELGDFDCFVLGNLLISQFQGAIVVPDFGFYAIPSHVRLIREDRLIAGVTSFEEVPQLKNHLLQIENKIPSACTLDDAETFARYRGIPTVPEAPYREFIESCIRPG